MTDMVVLITPAPGLRVVVRNLFEVLGLRVRTRLDWPAALPEAQALYVDIAAGLPEPPKRLAARLRARGCELILCAHWSEQARLREVAAAARAETLVYPLHPRKLLEQVQVRRVRPAQPEEVERIQLADIAGQLYAEEGVTARDLEALHELVQQRCLERLIQDLKSYRRLLSHDLAECCLLAECIEESGRSLFGPSVLFRAVAEELRARLPARPRILSLAKDGGREALALASLIDDAEVTSTAEPEVDWEAALPREWLRRVPRSFRGRLVAGFEDGSPRITKALRERLRWAEAPAEGYDLIVARRLDRLCDTDDLEASLHRWASLLSRGGRLLLGPGESIMARDFPLKREAISHLACYQREGAAP